jgi:hypothetical protein
MTMQIELQNLGTTPARQVRTSGKVFILRDEPVDDVAIDSPSTSVSTLAQGATMVHPHTYPLNQHELDGVLGKTLRFTSVGEVDYQDVFDTRYVNRYCFTWQHNTKQFSSCDRNAGERVVGGESQGWFELLPFWR